MRVAAIGDNCLDVYVEQDLLTVGGNALNVAVNWSRLGLAAQYFGAIGDDAAGTAVRESMRAAGVLDSDTVTLHGRTGVTLIRLVESNREFVFEEFGVGLDWVPKDDVIDKLVEFEWIHVAGLPKEAELIPRLNERNLKLRVSVDLSTYHDFDRLDGVEIAFISWDNGLNAGAHELAARVVSAGAQVAVVMCGEHGSLALSGAETLTTKAQSIIPIDTCGAGDSFIAAYITSHLNGNNPEVSLTQGTVSATRTCLHIGGFEQEPHSVPAWLKETYYEFI